MLSLQAKKFFLVLMTGGAQPLPAALGEETGAASVGARSVDRGSIRMYVEKDIIRIDNHIGKKHR